MIKRRYWISYVLTPSWEGTKIINQLCFSQIHKKHFSFRKCILRGFYNVYAVQKELCEAVLKVQLKPKTWLVISNYQLEKCTYIRLDPHDTTLNFEIANYFQEL